MPLGPLKGQSGVAVVYCCLCDSWWQIQHFEEDYMIFQLTSGAEVWSPPFGRHPIALVTLIIGDIYLLCVRLCTKHFICIIPHNLLNGPVQQAVFNLKVFNKGRKLRDREVTGSRSNGMEAGKVKLLKPRWSGFRACLLKHTQTLALEEAHL